MRTKAKTKNGLAFLHVRESVGARCLSQRSVSILFVLFRSAEFVSFTLEVVARQFDEIGAHVQNDDNVRICDKLSPAALVSLSAFSHVVVVRVKQSSHTDHSF